MRTFSHPDKHLDYAQTIVRLYNHRGSRGSHRLLGVLLTELGLAAGLGLLLLLLLQEEESVDLVLEAVLADSVGDLLTADQAGDNAGTDNEGQDEAVHAVPGRSTAGSSSTSIIVVQESESKELADQGILDGEQQSGPGDSGGNDTGSVALVAELSTISGPLKTPVDGTEEGKDLYQLSVRSSSTELYISIVLTTAP